MKINEFSSAQLVTLSTGPFNKTFFVDSSADTKANANPTADTVAELENTQKTQGEGEAQAEAERVTAAAETERLAKEKAGVAAKERVTTANTPFCPGMFISIPGLESLKKRWTSLLMCPPNMF